MFKKLFAITLLTLIVAATASALLASPMLPVPAFPDAEANQLFGRRPGGDAPPQRPETPVDPPEFEFPENPNVPAEPAEPAPEVEAEESDSADSGILAGFMGGVGMDDWEAEDWQAFFSQLITFITALVGIFGGMSAAKRGGILKWIGSKFGK